MLNKVILIGRLAGDPELRYTPAGQPVATFTIAVDRPALKEGDGNGQKADFIPVVTWRATAENVVKYLDKGRLVAVEGRLQIRSYQAKDGQKRKVAEVVASRVKFLPDGRRNGNSAASVEHDLTTPDEILDDVAETEEEVVPF